MESIGIHQPLNAAQMLLLQTFSQIKSEEERDDIQTLLLDYYRKRVDEQVKQFHFSDEKIADILNSH